MKDLLKLIACWMAFGASLVASGIVGTILHLRFAAPATNASALEQILTQWAAGFVIVVGLYPLARGLAAPVAVRALALGGFYFAALGVNGVIEAKYFTHMLDHGIAAAEVFYVVGAILLGGTLGWMFGQGGQSMGLSRHGWSGWAGRGIAAWLGWPVTYLLFGMCVAPFVVPYYNAGVAGLQIPRMGIILELQLLRSVIFLAASLPFIALWRRSRLSLWLALGLAHAAVVGLYGLVSATFLPPVLRVAHGLEITADSFAYAGLLVLLFAARRESESVSLGAQQLAAH
jgi:hypothetical protein